MPITRRLESLPLLLGVAVVIGTPSGLTAQNPSPWDLAFSFGSFAGQLQFADSTLLPTQDLFGGSVALDFGRGVLFRGFYWQGANEEFDGTDPISGYGGEIQFDVNLFSAMKPFFLGGVGRMDFDPEYQDALGRTPERTTTYTLGGGVAIDLARWLRLDVAARNYLFQGPRQTDVEVAEIRHSNLMLTSGLTITLGRRKNVASARSVIAGEAPPVPGDYVPVEYAAPGTQVVAQPGVVVVPGQQVVTQPGVAGAPAGVVTMQGDSAGAMVRVALADDAVRSILSTEVGYLDALYPGDARLGEERTALSGERADTLKVRLAYRMHDAFEYLATAEAAAVLESLDAQLDAYNVTLDAKDEILTAVRATLEQRVEMVEAEGYEIRLQSDSSLAWERTEARRRRRLSGTTGGSFKNGTQVLLGGQLGFETPWSPSIGFVPEVTLGFLDGGASALVQGSVRYFRPSEGAELYGGLGLGILVLSDDLGSLSGSRLVLTPIFGIEVPSSDLGNLFGGALTSYFVEYQGVGFFDLNRLVFGVNWGM